MAQQTVTLTMPEALYRRLQQRAKQAQHSVEDEVMVLVATAMPINDEIPTELLDKLTQLSTLNDAGLWRIARVRLPIEVSDELEALNRKRQTGKLSLSEAERAAELLRQYDLVMLQRAEAAWLLQQRGYDVSDLVRPV